jgi:hypothetical protein
MPECRNTHCHRGIRMGVPPRRGGSRRRNTEKHPWSFLKNGGCIAPGATGKHCMRGKRLREPAHERCLFCIEMSLQRIDTAKSELNYSPDIENAHWAHPVISNLLARSRRSCNAPTSMLDASPCQFGAECFAFSCKMSGSDS